MIPKITLRSLLGLVAVCLLTESNAQQCTITCPANITASASLNDCGAVINFPAPVSSGNCGTITTRPASGSFFPVGTTRVTVTSSNSSASCSFTVTVNDKQGPIISNLSATPNTLWPPNHKFVDVRVNYTTTDNCPGPITCGLSVTSNEPVNSTGDGNTAPDWIVIDDHNVKLRAERKGNGDGRIYTITVRCVDRFGNASTRATTVKVPHDMSSKKGNPSKNNLMLQASPNPSRNYFTVNTQSDNSADKTDVRLFDLSGRIVESKLNINANTTLKVGNNLKPGVYFIELRQGTESKKIQVIKQ